MLNVKPSLDRVDVLVEINDASTAIPRNSVIEANQSGLIAEPLVDITPQVKGIPCHIPAAMKICGQMCLPCPFTVTDM